jgi:hypothetical protein
MAEVTAMKYRKLKADQRAIVFELLIAGAMAVVIFFALLNIGTFINGTISSELSDISSSTAIDNTLTNISGGFDSTLNIMVVAAIITVITIPLAAVVAIKQLM